MVGAVVGAVALMMVAVVVMVFAVMAMLAVVLTTVVTWRVVGAMPGDGASGASHGERKCDGERGGYARY